MPEAENVPPLETYIAEQIRGAADELTDRWVDELRGALGVRPSRLLPTEALQDHVPEVIRGIADFAALPAEVVKSDIVDRLRLLAELRREQGYDVQELLVELEALSRIVFDRYKTLIERYPGDADPVAVAELADRLREGLAGIISVTIGMYREEEDEQKRELARRLAEYTRTIAHELKNPLNAANSSARMLQDGRANEEQHGEFIELIIRSLGRIDDLIQDIGALAVEESAEAEERWLPLSDVVKTIFEEVEEAAAQKDVTLEIDGELPAIRVDASRIEIALVNLVGNAVKYSDPAKPERWVRVGAEPASEVEDGQRAPEGGWVIHVADNGLGIPADLQNKVFQRHFRAHPDVAEGTGLGLAITHHVVTQRGGHIHFESEKGEGTTFYVTIPERQERPEERGGKKQP